jgi:AbiTii
MAKNRKSQPSLVEQLQADALDRGVPVGDLLRKAKVVAAKLDLKEFLAWSDHEISGYGPEDKVPPYRMVQGEAYGFNPYRGWQPVIFPNAEVRRRITTQPNGQSVAEIADLVSRGESGTFAIPLGAIPLSYGPGLEMGVNVQLQIDRSQLAGILDAVRNQILEWSLKLEKEGITGSGISFSERERKRAHQPTIISKINIKAEHITGVVGPVSGRASVRGNQTRISLAIDIDSVRPLVEQIKQHLDSLRLAPEECQAVDAEIDVIDTELESGEPNQSRVRSALLRLKEILTPVAADAAGNVIAAGILTAIHHILGIS